MPYNSAGRYYNASENRAEEDVASAARTTTGTGTAFNTDDVGTIAATLVVSAAVGTNPTLDVTLETSDATGATWTTVAAFAQQTTTNTGLYKVFGPLGYQSRWKWTIGGTGSPSFTFAIATTTKRTR